MDFANATAGTDHVAAALDHLGGERRRRTLRVLRDESARLDVADLAGRVACGEPRDAVRVDLVHSHLPALEDAGLVAWNREAGTATAADHPALDDPRFDRLLAADGDVVDCLAHASRRTVLAALRVRDGRTSRRTVARDVAARDADGDPPADAVEEALVRLHHVHLPKLADAGLVAYDAEDGRVEYLGHPALGPGADEGGSRETPDGRELPAEPPGGD